MSTTESTRTVADFSFEDLGVDSSSYFQGAGTAYTTWDEVYVGVGDTAREAGDSAMEQLASSDVTIPRAAYELIDAEVATMDDATSAHLMCKPNCCETPETCEHDWEDFDCELNHYVALYVRYSTVSADAEACPTMPTAPDA